MPHGPVELAAYPLAIALYLQDHRCNLARHVWPRWGAVRGAAGDRRRAGDMGERMSTGTATARAGSVAAGVAIGVPVLSNSLHKLGAQGWFHANATKGGLIQPATPTLRPPRSPDCYSRRPLHPPPPGNPPAPLHALTPPSANGRRHSALALHSPARGQSSRDPAPRPPVGCSLRITAPGAVRRAVARRDRACAHQGRRGDRRRHRPHRAAAGGAGGARARRRSRREYALYELHLSTHDQAKPQDLEDMVESIANIVRAWPAERIRDGQPYLALELICGHAPHSRSGREMQWSINIRCDPRGRRRAWTARSVPPTPTSGSDGTRPGTLPAGGRLRRARVRDAVSQGAELRLPLIARRRGAHASSPLEQIARAQVAVSAAVDRALPAHPHPVVLRSARPPPVPPARAQDRAPGALGTARRRTAIDVRPRRDARRRAHPEPQPVLARDLIAADTQTCARPSPPPSNPAAGRTGCTAGG